MVKRVGLLVGFSVLLTSLVSASVITTFADPALTGASTIDFTGTPLGNPASLTIDIVTFSLQVGVLNIENTNGPAFGLAAPDLQKDPGGSTLQLVFSGPVSALAFNTVTPVSGSVLNVYSNNNFTGLLESYAIPNLGTLQIAGLADAGIRSATITTISTDFTLYDDFKYVPTAPVVTPEPAAMYMLGSGLLALAGLAWIRTGSKQL